MSIRGKLIFITFMFTAIIILLMGMNFFAMNTLSTVRAYVGGEAFWSKGQKDAIYFLSRYAVTHREEEYKQYLENLNIPLGGKIARLELQKESSDLAIADAAFIQGKNHPHDVRAMSLLFKRFYWLSYFKKSILIWERADQLIEKLQSLGLELHTEIAQKKISDDATSQYLIQIEELNKELSYLEAQYSYTLGEAARWLTSALLGVSFSIALLSLVFGLWISIVIVGHILKSINALKLGTIQVEQGVLTTPIKLFASPHSKDELTQLAISFNKMTEGLSKAIAERDNANEMAHIGNWEWDAQHNTLTSSDEFYRILGLSPQHKKLTYKYLLERLPFNDRQAIKRIIRQSLIDKKSFSFDCKIKKENGEIRELNVQGRVLMDEEGKIKKLIGPTQDITERFRLQSQLIHSSKMVSLGEMANAVAHEINNPLTIIKLTVAQIQKNIENEPANLLHIKQAALKIDTTVDRISKIIQNLKS